MKSVLVALSLLVSTSAFAKNGVATIQSSEVAVNPARIMERVVLVNKKDNQGLVVQIIAEKTNGATDLSNTHRIILSISQIGEMTEKETSFVIGRSLGLESAKRVSGGVYEVKLNDADLADDGSMAVTKTIDARAAVNLVQHGTCPEFDVCTLKSSITVQTKETK